MSEYRFRITPGIVPQPLLEKAFFAAWGRTPRPSRIAVEGNELIVRSETKGSGTVHVPWPHKMLGVTFESTESLLPRESSYLLLKELGRGSLGRLLRKLFEWQLLGFRQPLELKTRTTEASRRFSRAVVVDDSDPEVECECAWLIEEFVQIAIENTRAFTDQALAWRTRSDDRLPVSFGIGLNRHPYDSMYEFDLYSRFLRDAFHCVMPMPTWRDIEPEPDVFHWARLEQRITDAARFGFEIVMGPLVSFETAAIPGWLLSRMNEEGYFESRATRFVNAVAERYGSLAGSWVLANRLNSFFLPEVPQARGITLIRILAQQIRSRGIESPILVGIDQPWGEYALRKTPEMDQVQVAESLVGCRDIDSFLLEMNFGFDSRSTFPRDPMAVSSMIDQWSFLGKKVYVALSIPSMIGGDALEVEQSLAPEFQWSEGVQQYWTETLLRMMLGKRMVGGIFWTLLQDPPENLEDTKSLDASAMPFSGLIDSHRVLKLAFKQFETIRKSLLK